MNRKQFFLERERDVRLRAYKWIPENPAKARGVVQLAHGMAEHILRYEDFAEYLTREGYIVYGHDHRGHGDSITAPDDWGFFADHNGFEKAVHDMHAISTIIHKSYPELPLVLFGHSMGSFLARRYIQLYGEELGGVIISGTGAHPGIIGKIGRFIAAVEIKRIGSRSPSSLMNRLTFGNFNRAFEPARTAFDFLSRDKEAVDAYIADEKCGFICSSQFYADLLDGMELIEQKEAIACIPASLPIYLIAGALDPVGNKGKGVQKVYQQYKEAGLLHIDIKLFPEARHEILHELNQIEVYEDIKCWLKKII